MLPQGFGQRLPHMCRSALANQVLEGKIAAALDLPELTCTCVAISAQNPEVASNKQLFVLPLRQPIHAVSPLTAGTLALQVCCTLSAAGSTAMQRASLGPALVTAGATVPMDHLKTMPDPLHGVAAGLPPQRHPVRPFH